MERQEAEHIILKQLEGVIETYKTYAPDSKSYLNISIKPNGYVNFFNSYWDKDKDCPISFIRLGAQEEVNA